MEQTDLRPELAMSYASNMECKRLHILCLCWKGQVNSGEIAGRQ